MDPIYYDHDGAGANDGDTDFFALPQRCFVVLVYDGHV